MFSMRGVNKRILNCIPDEIKREIKERRKDGPKLRGKSTVNRNRMKF
jgi:hypothetical protein